MCMIPCPLAAVAAYRGASAGSVFRYKYIIQDFVPIQASGGVAAVFFDAGVTLPAEAGY